MGRQYLTSTTEDGVATVVFNNPPANALSSPVMTEIEEVIKRHGGWPRGFETASPRREAGDRVLKVAEPPADYGVRDDAKMKD